MVYLTAGLVLVGAVAGANLLLTIGVVRRLREHSELIGANTAGNLPPLPKTGHPVRQFAAQTVEGEPVSRDDLPPGTVVVFLSPGCPSCEEKLPALVEQLRTAGGPRSNTLVVVAGTPEDTAGYVDALAPLARVVCQPTAEVVQAAFGVTAFPVAVTVSGDRIDEVFPDVAQLPASVHALTPVR